jgi:hypothetical protein
MQFFSTDRRLRKPYLATRMTSQSRSIRRSVKNDHKDSVILVIIWLRSTRTSCCTDFMIELDNQDDIFNPVSYFRICRAAQLPVRNCITRT